MQNSERVSEIVTSESTRSAEKAGGSDQIYKRLLIIEGVRVFTILAVLLVTLFFQFKQPEFISTEVLIPLYIMLFFSFFFNAVYLFFIEDFFVRLWIGTAFLFAADTIFVTGLIYYTGVNQSIFLFMYLVNISLCGFVFQRKGAVILGLFTSILFSFLIVVSPELKGQNLYFAVGLNNLAFFAVAGLSGYLSEQLNFMGSELLARDQEIRSLQNLNDLIIENIATGLMTISPDGQIFHANRASYEILDWKVPLDGCDVFSVLSDIRGIFSEIQASKDGGSGLGRFEIPHINPKGERLILGLSVSPLNTFEGVHRGYILIFQDLTQIKRMERALRRTEKLAAVGQLAAGIAHEIRNPLASISGSVQFLRDLRTQQTPEEVKLTAIIMKEIDRLNNLVSEFLDFVRPDTKVDDPVDIEALLKDVLEFVKLNDRLRKDVVQVLDLNCHQQILGHHDKLKQVFLNLIINAYQALIDIPSPQIKVSTQLKGGMVIVKIRDNGAGMSDTVLNRLFEPFHTTKPQGTGLGLATAHKILENHEAQIFVESRIGEGTEFTIEFTRLVGLKEPMQDLVAPFNEELNRFNLRKRGNG